MNIIGNKFEADFGMARSILDIESDTSLTFTILEKEGKNVNITETVKVEMTRIRIGLYMLTWKEKNGNTVTQIQDYEHDIVYSNWTTPAGVFTHQTGTLKLVNE